MYQHTYEAETLLFGYADHKYLMNRNLGNVQLC